MTCDCPECSECGQQIHQEPKKSYYVGLLLPVIVFGSVLVGVYHYGVIGDLPFGVGLGSLYTGTWLIVGHDPHVEW